MGDSLGEDADKKRRAVIVKTFDKLLAGLQKEDPPPQRAKARRSRRPA